ncbi:hypothetical protein [Pedobacter mendelii]|uniref:Uncharacterized protein n=1 Tax=Pedobacter mendelii TaxID=1908240 RepID=A0ABQ2BLQ3_9SPHI|nr:hypothetical protein [Pedobacter mendelii]GGI29143.1 hypothetical protein GCM10008119_36170 [Pedobacter mendelii]
MESILTDTEYKQIIRRIAALSSMQAYKTSEFEELKNLSRIAMDYEYRRYDFSLRTNGFPQNLSSHQSN